jgi:hypothetical protein
MAEITTIPSLGSNYYLRPLDENVNRLSYEHNFINIAAAEPSLGVPSTYSFAEPNIKYYFPVISIADNYNDSRKFTNKCADFVYYNNNIGIGTSTPNEKLTILGSVSASQKLTIGLAQINDTDYSSILGGIGHTLVGNYSTVVGGTGNMVLSSYSYIGGGFLNKIEAPNSLIVGGTQNYICGTASNINGGAHNVIEAIGANINGGDYNCITDTGGCSNISGGYNHTISGYASNINGGQNNTIDIEGHHSSISSGYYNLVETIFSNIVGGACNSILSNSGYSSIVGGVLNQISIESLASTIVGGVSNTVSDYSCYSVIAGGRCNTASSAYHQFIGSGFRNTTNSFYGSIVGGCRNCNDFSSYAFVGGGEQNCITSSRSSVLVGGFINRILEGGYNSILGGAANNICGSASGIVSGVCNRIGGYMGMCGATILGGFCNTVDTNLLSSGGTYQLRLFSSVLGGCQNTIVNSDRSSIVNGFNNNLRFSTGSSIIGGSNNFLLSSNNSFILTSNARVTGINDTTFVNNLSVLGEITSPTIFTEQSQFNKDLLVYGAISALSGIVSISTTFAETSSLTIENYGIGPALSVFQDGNYPISYFKTNQNTYALYISNTPLNPLDGNQANIGINTQTPNEELTVNGSISSNSIIYVSGGNSDIWNKSSLKSVTSIGDNINTSFTIYHYFNTFDVITQVIDNITSNVVYPLVNYTSLSSIKISFANLPSASQYKVIIRN